MGLALGGAAAILTFGLSFIIGLNIAAGPDSMESGMAAVLAAPCYGVAALGVGTAVFWWVWNRRL